MSSIPFLSRGDTSIDDEESTQLSKREYDYQEKSQAGEYKYFTWTRAYIVLLNLCIVVLIIGISKAGDSDGISSLNNRRSWCMYSS